MTSFWPLFFSFQAASPCFYLHKQMPRALPSEALCVWRALVWGKGAGFVSLQLPGKPHCLFSACFALARPDCSDGANWTLGEGMQGTWSGVSHCFALPLEVQCLMATFCHLGRLT